MKKPIQFGKYYLLDRINVGGMAEVFKAKAFGVEGFERLLAVKRILPNIAEDEEFITMFIDEAKIAVQLNHANVAQIFDLGKVEDSYFIALEFVHGKDVRAIFDRCKQKPVDGATAMPIAQACFIVMKACEGLDYAHNKRDGQGREMGLVHRDVSPQNILISYEGEVKLIDFGIAKAAGKMSKTQQGILKGKFGYMSPEQVRGLPLDRRSDVFSLGIVLYELLTGERLFVGESDFSTLEKVRNVEILPPSTYNRRISDELERIVMKALAKDVEDRYQNAIDLHDDLQAYMYTAGEFYSRKDLAAWMKRVWVADIESENAKNESYRSMPLPEARPPVPVPIGADRSRRNSIPPLPPSGAAASPPPTPPAASSPQRISAQHAVVAAPPPPPVAAKNGHQAPRLGAEAELGWDDEELATNIYDGPQDAGDAIVDDKPDDLARVALSPDGKPVPHPVAAAAPVLAPVPHVNGTAKKNGAARHDVVPTESLAMPPPGPMVSQSRPAAPTFEIAGLRPPARPRSNAALYAGVGVLGVTLCAAAIGLYLFLVGKPGEVVITSDPAVDVQILVDGKRMAVDGTPATLKLDPGSYLVVVQRDGYVPWNGQIEVKAGERLARRVTLEPLAAKTGFTLLSEPPGLPAFLDDKPLEGVTPLKVQSVTPGKHKVEVHGQNGQAWTQDVELAAGAMIELHATVGAVAAAPKPAPPRPVVDKPIERAPVEKARPAEKPAVERAAAVERTRPSQPARDLPRLPKEDARSQKPALADEDPTDKAEKPPVRKVAAVEKPPAVERSTGGEGYLRIQSKPWTNIAIDGKDTGLHTPQTQMKLGAGSHRITISNPTFNVKETFSIDIKAGETVTVTKNLLKQQDADSD